MSKFDAVLKRIEEQLPVTGQQQQQAAGVAPKPATTTGQPTQQQNTQQQQTQLKNPQAIEKIADELANINDPNKIKQILGQLMQSLTVPKTNG